ncbi:hypothetical protein HDU82_008530 [Entophlyctis luteolus]|nr:hypothetical protein HDU82_008530 [Entophlyctis luteolus]
MPQGDDTTDTDHDDVDAQLVRLINKRAHMAAAAAPASAPAACHRAKRLNRGPLRDDDLERIYRQILAAAETIRPCTVAFLGPNGSYTSQVARTCFANCAASFLDLPEIADVARAVNAGTASHGVIPIENSTKGSVELSYDALLANPDIKISGEHFLRIQHCLVSKCSDLADIKKSLGQTTRWCEKNLQGVECVAVSSNSAAAILATKEAGVAAICSEECAEIYGLNILRRNIEDKKNNTTRFVILSNIAETRTGKDKTILLLTSVGEQGSSVSGIFALLGTYAIEIIKVDTRPMGSGKSWDYGFFVEIRGHVEDDNVSNALAAAARLSGTKVRVVGSFPESSIKKDSL